MDSDKYTNIEFYTEPISGDPHIKFLFNDPLCEPDFLVDEKHKERFPQEWAAFEAGEDQRAGQTHLREVPWIDEVARQHLYSRHIFTVEVLANLPDSGLAGIGMYGRKMREKALAHMEAAEKAAGFDHMTAQLSEKDQQLAALTARLDALEAPKQGPKTKQTTA